VRDFVTTGLFDGSLGRGWRDDLYMLKALAEHAS